MNNKPSSGVEFQFPIQIIKSFGINVLHSGKQDYELRAAIAILEAAQKSELPMKKLLLIIGGTHQDRLLLAANDLYNLGNPVLSNKIMDIIAELTPKPQEQENDCSNAEGVMTMPETYEQVYKERNKYILRCKQLEAINAELVAALNDAYMDGIFEHVEVARKIKTALKHAEESNG